MRMLFLLLLGLSAGALGGSMAARSIAMGHAYPRGVMAVLQVRLGNARRALEHRPSCDLARGRLELAAIARFSSEIAPALNADTDRRLLELSAQMLATAERASEAEAATSCNTLVSRIRQVDEACTACHREYR